MAEVFGARSIAVMLTGMGRDGVFGIRSIRRSGGHVVAQDEASSLVFGMPGEVIAAGMADSVLPLDAIASCLMEMTTAT